MAQRAGAQRAGAQRAGAQPAGAEPAPPVDLRLAAGALAAWLTTLAVLAAPSLGGFLLGGLLAAASGALLLAGTRRWAPAVALLLGCAAAAAIATAVRVQARDSSPVARLATERAAVVADLVVTDDPRPLPGGSDRVAVPARVERVAAGAAAWRGSARVLVLAPSTGWQGLLPSQHLRADGRLTPPRRGDLTAAVLTIRGPPELRGGPSLPQRAAGHLRDGLREAAAVLPDGPRGLLPGLVVGDRSGLDPVLVESFKTTGLTHLVAVSGTNVAIVAGSVLLLLRAATAGPRTAAVGGGLALAGFVVLARPSPSVLRAAVMGGIALIALAAGRPRAAVPSLALTVLVLLLAVPSLAGDPGFALSVAATAALLLLAPGFARRLRLRGVPRGIAEAVAVPAVAHLATAPLIAGLSGTLSLVAIPANLLAEPAVAPATVLGVLIALVAPVSHRLARLLARVAGLPVGWIVLVAERGARVPGAQLPWPAGLVGGLTLLGALAVAVWLARLRAVRRVTLAAVTGIVVVGLPAGVVHPGWPPRGWLLVACDVGQGDALVLNAGPGAAVVVDAGPDPVAVDACLRRLGVRQVPLLVLTHLHADHVGGLSGVLRRRAVGAIEVGPLREPASAWRSVRDAAGGAHLPLWTAAVGEAREVAGIRLEVVAPRAAAHGTRSDPNNSSVVLRVRDRGHTILLTGDAEVEAQDAMLRGGTDLSADVLKTPHHGSAWQSPAFLARVHPALAVISVGRGNDYGHPAPALLAELARLGARTLRTDQSGDIAVCDDAGRLFAVTRSHPPP
ncbi:MAG TPA: DNA internalization-related competence protein ComEC/Rec2 [Mycobacteriales bacterium]|nr:DNA internalization-related competence protein ComEC/Rec2 [Mycobacteriales bacterium]